MADLSGVRAKLRRASAHRQAFDELFEEFVARRPYSIVLEYDLETGWHTFRWSVSEEPPLEEMALVFGDILANLRATLDYLVWQLVLLGGSRPGRQTMFPIVKREKDWDVQGRAALRGVPDEWASLIEAMQPFHRYDLPEAHPLAILEQMNNINKHRFLPVAVLTAEEFGYLIHVGSVPEGESFESREFLDRPVVQGGELARFRSESGRQIPVQLNQQPRFRISFKDGLQEGWTPFGLVEWVSEAVAQFEAAFV